MNLPIPLPFIYLLYFFERSSSVSSHKNRNYEKDDFSVGDTGGLEKIFEYS